MDSGLKSTRLTVFLIVLLDVMGLGLIIPAQPFLAESFGATAFAVTQLGTIYSGMQFFLSPFWGSLSDRVGRRPVLLTTLMITGVGHTIFALSDSLLLLFIARGLTGIGAANISTAQAVLSDTHPPAERSRAMALVGAAFGLGFVLGPALGGSLFLLNHRAPALLAAVLSVVNLILVGCRVGETRSLSGNTPPVQRAGIIELFRADGALRHLIVTTLFMMTAFSLMEQSVGLFIKSVWVASTQIDGLQEATWLTSIFLVVVGVTAVVVQGFLVRRWLISKAETVLIRCGFVTISFTLALIPCLGWFGSYSLFLISGSLLALGSGMFNPSMLGLISLSSPPDKQGLGLAINQSANALGRIIGPLFAGALFTHGTYLPFFVGSALALAALATSWRLNITR